MLIPNVPRVLKMACGENPKRVYGEKDVTPMSRMGAAWLMRQEFYAGAELRQRQDQWDCANKASIQASPRPYNISLEGIVSLLRGEVNLNVHCYKVEDLEMMIRSANEFGFKINTFQHALEAWKIPDILKANGISVATFSDSWGFKMEAYDASVHAPKILSDAGVNLVLKSDHPVTSAKNLIKQAARSTNYGLSPEKALQAVTANPAKAAGISDRIGTLENGKSADLVIWDRYPLAAGSRADKVIIEGELTDDLNLPAFVEPVQVQVHLPNCSTQGVTPQSKIAVTGVTVNTMNANGDTLTGATILVQDGVITCLSATACQFDNTWTVYNLQGGVVIPGIVASGVSELGTKEISQEGNSGDGTAYSNCDNVRAFDAVQLQAYQGKKLRATLSAGVTTVVAKPTGSCQVAGIGATFNPVGRFLGDTLTGVTTNVVSSDTYVHVTIGNDAKGAVPSISQQISHLRDSLRSKTSPFDLVIAGNLTLGVAVNQADQIARVVEIAKEFGVSRLVIFGGAEAHTIANWIAQQNINVGVVLNDFLNGIQSPTFESWRDSAQSSITLSAAGIKVAFGDPDDSIVRNLRWLAAAAVAQGLPYNVALGAITRTPAQIFLGDSSVEGEISVNSPANFVLFSGEPLSIQSSVELVVVKGMVSCKPIQL
jgi:imidazolonepropionase-like amidohydrolase